jgi:hypothetical protein
MRLFGTGNEVWSESCEMTAVASRSALLFSPFTSRLPGTFTRLQDSVSRIEGGRHGGEDGGRSLALQHVQHCSMAWRHGWTVNIVERQTY